MPWQRLPLSVLYVLCFLACACARNTSRFQPRVLCVGKGGLMAHPCAFNHTSKVSILWCATACHSTRYRGGACVGVGLDNSGRCIMLRPCENEELVSSSECISKARVFLNQDKCENDGVWDGLAGKCRCVRGWVGEHCQRKPQNCSELDSHGYGTGKMWVQLEIDGVITPFPVRCFIEAGTKHETVLYKRTSIQRNMNMTYEKYVDGFSTDRQNYCIGLKNIFALNHSGHDRLVAFLKLQDVELDTPPWTYAWEYTGFKFGPGAAGYAFDFDDVTSYAVDGFENDTLKDCLGPLKGIPFSTFDHDVDGNPGKNCAAEVGVGWWFKSCKEACNPMGNVNYVNPSSWSAFRMDGLSVDQAKLFKNFQIRFIHRP